MKARLRAKVALGVIVPACFAASTAAHGFGAAGHRIAGEIAERRLCANAAAAVLRYGAGQHLRDLGGWADRVRSTPAWEHSAPWHYVNSADSEPLRAHRAPRGGDLLWAVDHFRERLADERLAFGQRADALRFFVHFLVDLHQPLHVGRAEDRGGNTVVVEVDGERTNLHRLWDSGLIERGLDDRPAYAQSVEALAAAGGARWSGGTALDWAAESKALRPVVYAVGREPDARYLAAAGAIVRRRLAQAGVRLADELDRIFCAR